MKYKILTDPDELRLENKVNEHLADGWELSGSLTMAMHRLCQAMTKGEKVRPGRLKGKEVSKKKVAEKQRSSRTVGTI